MRPARLLSALIGLATVGVTLWMVLSPPVSPGDSADSGRGLVHQLDPGQSLDLVVRAGTLELRLSTLMLMRDMPTPSAHWSGAYDLEVAWLDGDSAPVATRVLTERTRLSRHPTLLPEGIPRTLRDSPHLVSDPRTTVLPARELLPSGGRLRVTAPVDGPPILLRAWGEEDNPLTLAQDLLGASTQRVQRLASSRLGVLNWDQLNRHEQRSLASLRRLSMPPTGDDSRDRPMQSIDGPGLMLPHRDRLLAETRLEPGRALALNLLAPATVEVFSGTSLEGLAAELRQTDGGDAKVVTTAAQRSLPGVEHGQRLQVTGTGAVSLVLRNSGTHTLAPMLFTQETPVPTLPFGWAPARSFDDMGLQGEGTLLAPEWRVLRTWSLGPERGPVQFSLLDGPETLLFTARPTLTSLHDEADRRIEVRILPADGGPERELTLLIRADPSPFERLIDDGSGLPPPQDYVGEPDEHYVHLPAGQFVLTAPDEVLVDVRRRTAPRGEPPLYQRVPEDHDLRYRWRPPTRWRDLPPDNEPTLHDRGQASRVLANVRLRRTELAAASNLGSSRAGLRYRSLPHRDFSSVWLLPGDVGAAIGYCRYEPSVEGLFPYTAQAALKTDHELVGLLRLSSSAHLGEPWRVELDGVRWRHGLLRQRVTRLRSLETPIHRQALLVAPPGSALWLRTWAPDSSDCQQPYRALRLTRVAPGETAHWTLSGHSAAHLVSVSGLGEGPARVEMRIDDGTPTRIEGVTRSWTRAIQSLTLEPAPGVGEPLHDPDQRVPLLSSAAMAVRSDLSPDPHVVSVTNHSDGVLYLRTTLSEPLKESR